MKKLPHFVLTLTFVLTGCATATAPAGTDPMPAWSDGAAKQKIIAFVTAVTTPGGSDYVEPALRIAVFDNDGTLWSERPLYFPIAFIIDRIKALAPSHPEWAKMPAIKAIMSGGPAALGTLSERELLAAAALVETGMTQEDYRAIARQWLAQAQHPVRERRYETLVYLPMLQLLTYLRAHAFKTFVVTGGFVDFTRALAADVYGIPPEQVIGTRWKLKYGDTADGASVVMRLPEIESFNNETTKVTNIEALIGGRPLLAVGNSDGDLAMLTYTDDRVGPSLDILVHHDDAAREYQYDAGAQEILQTAFAREWVVVSIKHDFDQVYPSP